MSHDEMDSIRASLDRIERALTGDAAMGSKGIAQRLDDVEARAQAQAARTDALERKLITWGGIATGASVVITHLKVKLFGQ